MRRRFRAWPGNANVVTSASSHGCERLSASEGAASAGLRGRGTQSRSPVQHFGQVFQGRQRVALHELVDVRQRRRHAAGEGGVAG